MTRMLTLPRRRAHVRGFTLVELLAVLAVMGVLVTVAVSWWLPTQREVMDRSGGLLLASTVVDARTVASANHYRYDTTPGTLAGAMNPLAAGRAGSGMSVEYQPGPVQATDLDPATGVVPISVHASSPTLVGVAVMSSATGTTGTCLMGVDHLRTGSQYARADGVPTGDGLCSGQTAVTCAQGWDTAPGAGTLAAPFRLAATDGCLAG